MNLTNQQDYLQRYGFNPYDSSAPEWWLRDFHRRHVSFFAGCDQVLDLGAGSGLFLEELRAAGIHGVGVESFSPHVEQGRARGLTYFQGDIFAFFNAAEGQAVAAKAGGVYCSHVLEHLDPPQVFELFDVLHRCCKPGTRLRMITNNPADIGVLGDVFWGDLTHRRLYPPALLTRIVTNRGLKVTQCRAFLGLKLGKRQQLRRYWDFFFWGANKWRPNLMLDCVVE